MNKHVVKLFSCCLDNRVMVIETNFAHFYKLLKNIEPKCNSDRWYINKFKQEPEFSQIIEGKNYYFQQLV